MTLGGLLESFRMWTGHQKKQTVIRKLKPSSPPHCPRRKEGLKIEIIFDRLYGEASIKIFKVWVWEGFQVAEHKEVQGG